MIDYIRTVALVCQIADDRATFSLSYGSKALPDLRFFRKRRIAKRKTTITNAPLSRRGALIRRFSLLR